MDSKTFSPDPLPGFLRRSSMVTAGGHARLVVEVAPDSLANACLIAAAPELLLALANATGSLAACAQILSGLGHTKTAAAIDVLNERFMVLMAKANSPAQLAPTIGAAS